MKRSDISNMFMRNIFTFYVFYLIKSVYKFFFYYIIPDKIAIQYKFRKKMGYKLDLNNPVNFNEKLQWLKLHDRKDEYTDCVDKFKVRNYIKKILGNESKKYLIPLVFYTKDVKDLCIKNMPDYPVIIKSNHDQGGFKIIWNKNEVNWHDIQMFFLKRLKNNFYWNNREWPYKNVERRIVVEKLINDNGNLPMDVKMHCFHGKIKIIQISRYDNTGIKKFAFFDINLNRIKKGVIDTINVKQFGDISFNFSNINSMFNIAKKLSMNKKYVRIDLYLHNNNIYIGEMTFFPTAGYINYFTNDFLLEIGSWININD